MAALAKYMTAKGDDMPDQEMGMKKLIKSLKVKKSKDEGDGGASPSKSYEEMEKAGQDNAEMQSLLKKMGLGSSSKSKY